MVSGLAKARNNSGSLPSPLMTRKWYPISLIQFDIAVNQYKTIMAAGKQDGISLG